jgi:YidC/Oxa1 family membrane protein insertase
MPVALTGLMFLQSRIQPMTGDSAQQKMLMYGMPLMFGVMGLWFPAGLTVYITTNTILGLAHTLWMKRGAPVPVKGLAKSEPAASSTTSSTSSTDREQQQEEAGHRRRVDRVDVVGRQRRQRR